MKSPEDRCSDLRAGRPQCVRWVFRLSRRHIAYVRFVLEAYEGLAQMTSEPGRAEVTWTVPASQVVAARALATALRAEVGLEPLAE